MLALVLTLGFVIFAMRKAAQPQTWHWLFGDTLAQRAAENGKPTEDETIDTRRPAEATLPTGVFRTRREETPPDARSEKQVDTLFPGIDPSWLSALRDDTVFRSTEVDAWYVMLAVVRDASSDQFAVHSVGMVGFTQLYRQPDAYRGKAVELSGVVKRCHRIKAHDNPHDIQDYYRCWLWPQGSVNPVVVYSLTIPQQFPTGMSINEDVSVEGLFYKRWAYKAVEDIRVAPLVIARTLAWEPGKDRIP